MCVPKLKQADTRESMEDIEERRSRPFTIFCMLLLGTQGGRSHLSISCGLYKKRPSAHTQRKKDAAAQFPQRGPVAALPAAAASWELTETHRHHVDVVSLSLFYITDCSLPQRNGFQGDAKNCLASWSGNRCGAIQRQHPDPVGQEAAPEIPETIFLHAARRMAAFECETIQNRFDGFSIKLLQQLLQYQTIWIVR